MKKGKSVTGFNWSRNVTNDGVHSVYIATPGSYSHFGKEISKEEISNALSTWNKINDLKAKKTMFKNLFIATLVSIPFISIIYNIVITLAASPK